MQGAFSTAKRVALFGILGALTIALSLLEGLLPRCPPCLRAPSWGWPILLS